MARIELPPLDADSFEARLEEAIPKNAAGQVITAWHTFAQGVKKMRTMLQDGHNQQSDQLAGHKRDLDQHAQRLHDLEEWRRVQEATPAPRPFRRGSMYAWVFTNGTASGSKTPAQLAAAHREKYGAGSWAALEMDDPTFKPANVAAWPDCVREFHARGCLFGAWFTNGGEIRDTPPDADLAIAELEGPWGGDGDYEGIMNTIAAGQLPKCPIAICTNFSNASPATARPLIDAGFHCLTEAYMNQHPTSTPDSMDRIARGMGWPTSQPVIGMYPVEGVPTPDYSQWMDWPPVDYLGEYVL